MKMNKLMLSAVAVLPLLALPTVAHAQDAEAEEAAKPLDVSVEVGVASDYRFRGLSLSGGEPELTAEVSVEHQSGLYVSAWASNVDLGLGGADDMEVDWTAGFSKDVGKVNIDAGVIYYSYFDHSDFNYVEIYGSLGTKVGPGEMRVGIAYAPKQNNLGGDDNVYYYISGETPVGQTPFSLHATFGYENGAFGNHKKDWLVGASVDLGGGLTASLDYVDTAHDLTGLGGPTAVASLKFGF